MRIKFQSLWFVLGVTIGSLGLSQISANAEEARVAAVAKAEKKQVVLGHRIGPGNQEMLVYNR